MLFTYLTKLFPIRGEIADVVDGIENILQRLRVLESRILAVIENVDDESAEHEQGTVMLNLIRDIKEQLSKSVKELEKIYYWRLSFIAMNLSSLEVKRLFEKYKILQQPDNKVSKVPDKKRSDKNLKMKPAKCRTLEEAGFTEMTAELPDTVQMWQHVDEDLTGIMLLCAPISERISAIRSRPLLGSPSTIFINGVVPLICLITNVICQYFYPVQ